MQATLTPPDEAERLRVLRSYGVLDTPPEPAFDDLTALAAQICETPIALVALEDRNRQWFKSRVGLDLTEVPRATSFCVHGSLHPGELLLVPDAALDPRFADNPFVTGEPRTRFYAAAPLVTESGHVLGTLSVIDRRPRELSPAQQEALGRLARQVISQLELRRALTASRESEERYRLIFDQIPIPLFIIDHETLRYLAVNDVAVRNYGYSGEEFSQMTVLDLRPAEDRARLVRELSQTTHGLASVGRWRHRRKDASVFPVEIFAHDLTYQGHPARLVLALDVTHQAHATAALQTSEARFRALSESAPLGIFECDVAGNATYRNHVLLSICGRTAEEMRDAGWMEAIHPEDRGTTLAEINRGLAEGRGIRHRHRVLRPDGVVRWVQLLTSPQHDAANHLVGYVGTVEDITQQHLAGTALAESEERYRQLMMLSPDAQYVHVDGHITLVNPAFCQLLGASQPAQLLDRSLYDFIHPDEHASVRARQPLILSGGVLPPLERKYVRLDGTALDVEVSAVAWTFRGRKEIQVIARDISRRKQAEEELRSKTALLEAQLDSTADGILIVDPQGRKIVQNHRFLKLLKIPPPIAGEDHHGATLRFATESVRHSEAFIEKVRYLYAHPHETSRDEVELKDGTVLDRYSAPVLGQDGKNYGRIWTFADITARKAAESAVRENEERFKLVARAVSDAIWDWDLASGTVWRSANYETVFGLATSTVTASRDGWSSRIHPDDRDRVLRSLHHAIDSGRENWREEYRFLRRDDTYAFVQDRGQIVRDATGRAQRMVGGMTDLTEHKKLEHQFLRAQRMESIGTLASGIAHDLNNVLTPILMSIGLLREVLEHDAAALQLLGSVETSTRRGAELVRQVLSFARGVEGERTAVDVRPLLKELARIAAGTFPLSIQIVTEAPSDLWPVSGDATQLHQVLMNLAVNARDAMPGGGTLTLAAENVAIDHALAQDDDDARPGPHVLLRVTDTGHGIPPEVRDRIFEPFYTTKPVGHGTGLGLSTVHAIVRSHGGHIAVESEVGRGTTFKVYLPANPHLSAGAPTPPPAALPRGRGECVLVADDEPAILNIARHTLEAYGYRVLIANNGADALGIFAQHGEEISLVVTDMMMPVMDGSSTIDALRRLKPGLRLVAASGLHGNATRAALSGVKHFLPKPYTAEALIKLCREVLDAPAT